MSWWCHVSNLKSLGSKEPHQRNPYPPSPGWIYVCQVVPDAHFGHILCPGGMKFQIHGLQDEPTLNIVYYYFEPFYHQSMDKCYVYQYRLTMMLVLQYKGRNRDGC